MIDLKSELELLRIELIVTEAATDFRHKLDDYHRLGRGSWQFAVLDLMDQSMTPARRTGVELARDVRNVKSTDPWFPIFVVTSQLAEFAPEVFDGLPTNAYLRYKLDPYVMAHLIRDELLLRGAYTNPKKVFLACLMRNGRLSEHGLLVQDWFKARGVDASPIDGQIITDTVLNGILDSMEKCSALVAICTRDDNKRPRQNVVMEIGIMLGASGGPHRLIILEQEGTIMPSDLGGVFTRKFKESPSEVLGDLEDKLIELGVDLEPVP